MNNFSEKTSNTLSNRNIGIYNTKASTLGGFFMVPTQD